MNEVVVHTVPGSPYTRSVLLALEEKGVPSRIQALKPGDHRGEAHLARHPFGRMPVIEHDGYVLYETQAILRYIDATFPGAALQPKDPRAIGRMSQIMGILDWYLFPKVAAVIVFHRIIAPTLLGLAPDEAAVAAAVPDARLCLGELGRLLGKQAYLAYAEMSLADLMLAPQIDYIAMTPEGNAILAGTALEAWLERMRKRPSMIATQPPGALRRPPERARPVVSRLP